MLVKDMDLCHTPGLNPGFTIYELLDLRRVTYPFMASFLLCKVGSIVVFTSESW